MERFTSAIKKSLETENWYSALYLSLTLPDICARLESDDGKTNRTKYITWFDKYLAKYYQHKIGGSKELHVFISGNDCYALRCALLHEGGTDITTQICRETLEKFHFTVVGAHCNQINNVLQLDVPSFCKDVCNSIDSWYEDFKTNHSDKIDRLNELITVHVGPHNMGNGVRFG
ncbi:MAG: hypothetical protein Q8O04_03150 [Deltaproteobacteria bacterium]|nr:hypothetical protein [Deltaproteobacteria bacterium]